MTRLVALVALVAAGSARGDVTLKIELKHHQGKLYLHGSQLRMDEPGGSNKVLLVDAASRTFTILVPGAKTWIKLSEEDARKLSALERSQLAQKMSRLPPEAQERMKKQLAKKAPTTYEATGAKKSVAGFACSVYRELADGQQTGEGCYIAYADAKISTDEMRTVVALAELLAEVVAGLGGDGDRVLSWFARGPGLPALHDRLLGGEGPADELRLISLEKGAIPAALFTIPAGYAEKRVGPFGERGGWSRSRGAPEPDPETEDDE